MINIEGTTISMTRGDTLKVVIGLKTSAGESYVPADGDVITFTAKESYKSTEPVIVKDIPTDTMLLTLDPADTKPLKMPASYVYDIQLVKANGDTDTFIDRATLEITEEVG